MAIAHQSSTDTAFRRLLLAAGRGEPAALARINARYLPALTRFAASRNADDPGAVANQALFDGLRSIDRLRAESEAAFRSYLFTCVTNRVRSERRRRAVITVPLDPIIHGGDTDLDPAELTDEGWFGVAVDDLPRDQRAVIVERFVNGSTIGETAASLDKTPDAVKHLQARALVRIRRYVLTAGLAGIAVLAALVVASVAGDRTVRIQPADDPTPDPSPAGPAEQRNVDADGNAVQSGIGVPRVLPAPLRSTTTTPPGHDDAVTDGGPSAAAGASRGEPTDGDDDAPPPVPTTTTPATTSPQPADQPETEADSGTHGTGAAGAAPALGKPCANTEVALDRNNLRPNNGRMVRVEASFHFPAGCDPATVTVSLLDISVVNGNPKTDIERARFGEDDRIVRLRAAQEPRSGLRYTLTWLLTDAEGGQGKVSATIGAANGGKGKGQGQG